LIHFYKRDVNMGGWASLFSGLSKRIPNSVTQRAVAAYFTVEAWSKVGLRGYHSGQRTVERANMKVQIIFNPRRERRKGRKEKGEGEKDMKWKRRKREEGKS